MSKNINRFSEKDNKGDFSKGRTKIYENIQIFKCPVCGSRMFSNNLKSIYCLNNHCFDISKRGYVNLLMKSVKSLYDKKLFESRNIICRSSFYSPVIEHISDLIAEGMSNTHSNNIKIIDAGCGEGSHLTKIIDSLHSKTNINFLGVGIDISKEGIQIASKNYSDHVWCVADLANMPFMDSKFDIVLNILTPSNYAEFLRIITDKGLLIKVVPGSKYFKELRDLFYNKTDKKTYSNDMIIKYFSSQFNVIGTKNIEYKRTLNKESFEHLINMTPLSWGVGYEEIQKALNFGINDITVDLTVILGTKKYQR
jgi:23S rRNA (guanine745-N1)-methyltransferase